MECYRILSGKADFSTCNRCAGSGGGPRGEQTREEAQREARAAASATAGAHADAAAGVALEQVSWGVGTRHY
jgi:hypothetical protein